LSALNDLKIRTCSGFFSDFVKQTENRMSIHLRSSAVEWRFNYNQPSLGDEILFAQIAGRFPDLQKEHRMLGVNPMYVAINDLTANETNGAAIRVLSKDFKNF